MSLEFKMNSIVSVKNSIFIGEVFQIEVSDGPVHSLGRSQKACIELGCLRGLMRSLYVLTIRTDHSNVCTKSHVH